MDKKIVKKLEKLYVMWKSGELGGAFMPEDSNPNLDKQTNENFLYFTLPMALNYQRNSYKLWESAKQTYLDESTKFVFDVEKVLSKNIEEVKFALTRYKIALQPNKQTEIWLTLCNSFKKHFNGDIRKLFKICNYDIDAIREYVVVKHKKDFPYLSGKKIFNYWLYVIIQYTDLVLKNKEKLTIAPDTHIIQSSLKLGIIDEKEISKSNIQSIVIERFEKLLKDSKHCPIDFHTPLWLWSRNNFKDLETLK